MRKRLYAIRDIRAVEVVGGVHVFPGDPAAVRFFNDIATDKQTMVGRHLKDHELLCVGVIDTETGEVAREEEFPTLPRQVVTGAAIVALEEDQGNG